MIGYTAPNEYFDYGYHHSDALVTVFLQKSSEYAMYYLLPTACEKP